MADVAPSIQRKLDELPPRPGVYVFRGGAAEPLYVGKASSLRSRVRSYFQPGSSDDRAFLPLLLSRIEDVETIVTHSEKEATILENNLIKELQPRFNVKLRDDKEYLNLRLDPRQRYPRLELVRRPSADGARYFGPYHSATAARRTAHLVEKHFQLRTCSDRELATRTRPCLQYQIKRCLAPCVKAVDEGLYSGQVRAVGMFLDSRHDELTRDLTGRMHAASDATEYELAGIYRDQLRAVDAVRQTQRVVAVKNTNQDVLGLYREGDLVELSLLLVRGGRVVDAHSYSRRRVELPDDEIVASFIRERYGQADCGATVPSELLVPAMPEGHVGIAEWLGELRDAGGPETRSSVVRIVSPRRGARRKLLDLAMDNARHSFDEKRRADEDVAQRLGKLQARLRLPTVPRRIECTDISHLGGQDTYGSVVAMTDGALDKERYKMYRVKVDTEGDDYAAMYHVLSRRFDRGRDSVSEWQLPDLFVVDGGRGQLAVALAAAADLGLHDLCIVGLAKEREAVSGERLVDRVYLPGQKNPISLRPNSPELFFLAMLRDEAHRFANSARKRAGKKRRLASRLDDIPSIGARTRVRLLKAFGSARAVLEATEEQLAATPGVSRAQARAIRSASAGGSPKTDAERS